MLKIREVPSRRVPIYGRKRVRAGWHWETRREPRWVTEQVQIDTRIEERTIERWGWVREKVGERTVYESVPRYVERRVRQGEEKRWVLERVPEPPVAARDERQAAGYARGKPLLRPVLPAEPTPEPGAAPTPTPPPDQSASGTPVAPSEGAGEWSRGYLDESRDRRRGGLVGAGGLSAEELLEAFTDQVKDPATWWDAVTDGQFARPLQEVEGLPDLRIVLPWLRGFGPPLQRELLGDEAYLDLLQGTGGPLIKHIDTDLVVRTLGRSLGDVAWGPLAPYMMSLGWAITLAPEQIENIMTGAPASEYLADGIVDTGGFILSEIAGIGGGAIGAKVSGGNPAGILGGKFITDVLVGGAYDTYAEKSGWREKLTALIEAQFDGQREAASEGVDWMERENEVRVPTPPPESSPQSPPEPEASETPQPSHRE